MKLNYFWGAVFGLTGLALASTAAADTAFARSDAHAARSLVNGVGTASLPVLVRDTSNPAVVASVLLSTLCESRCNEVARSDLPDRKRFNGNGFHLEVFGDGSLVEFVNEVASASARSQPPTSVPMTPAALESAARSFIATKLASQIVLGPGESLVPEAVANRTVGGGAVHGPMEAAMEPARVTGNRIIFTREIDGVPVVGNGSKVIVTFLNDGTVESFRYDWPHYTKSGRITNSLSSAEIIGRVQQVVGMRTGAPPQSFVVPAGASTPLPLGQNMTLNRLACGYFDAGLTNRATSAVVQSGCYYHALHSMTHDGVVLQAGYAGAVPGSGTPENDVSWPELAVLSGKTLPATPPGDAASPGQGSAPATGK